jgi:hypothetical protein
LKRWRLEVFLVRELRTLKRTRPGSRVRSVQGRLSIEFGDEDEAGGEALKTEPPARSSGFRRPVKPSPGANERNAAPRVPTPVFHPLAYRSVVADWPVDWRERWGRRANELEETGLSWRDAEAQAFVEVWHLVRREGGSEPASAPSIAPTPEEDET